MDITQEEINELIDRAVERKIAELKLATVGVDNTSPLERTDRLLSLYPSIRDIDSIQAKEATERIEQALDVLRADPYIKIIPLLYFYRYSREDVAKRYGVSPTTITRQKNRLLVNIKQLLFCEV